MKLLSYYLSDWILSHLFNVAPFSPPLVMGVALSRYNPGPSGYYIDEPPLAYNYSRVATYASWWTHDGVSSIYNSTAIVFDEASADWGEITHFALFDSANYGAGNMLFYGELPTPAVVSSGCIARFKFATLSVFLD